MRGVFLTYMLLKMYSVLDNPFVHPESWLHTLVLNCAYVFQLLQYFWCYLVTTGFVSMASRHFKDQALQKQKSK
jgi:hypothetical protein